MKVAFLTPQMIVGGAETYVITKSRWLVARGHSVVVVSAGGENVCNLPAGVKHIEFATEVSPASFSAKGYRAYIAQLSQILVKEGIDVIEAHNTSPAIHTAMSFGTTNIPYLINILNERTYARNPFLARLTRNIAPLGLFYALTEQMLAYIEHRVGCSLLATILPIPVRGVEPSVAPHNGRYVLSVCRMADDKMYVKYLIRDFIALHRQGVVPSDYRLVVVGDGALYGQVKAEADQAPHVVEMRGTVVGEALDALYRNAEVYVGTGTTLLLGASCGTPCLIPGFSIGSMPYCWGVWGERPQDAEVLAVSELQKYPRTTYFDTLAALINNPDQRVAAGQKAKQLFEAHYAVEPIMERWETEYIKIIAIFANGLCASKETVEKSDISPTIRCYRPVWRLRKKFKR